MPFSLHPLLYPVQAVTLSGSLLLVITCPRLNGCSCIRLAFSFHILSAFVRSSKMLFLKETKDGGSKSKGEILKTKKIWHKGKGRKDVDDVCPCVLLPVPITEFMSYQQMNGNPVRITRGKLGKFRYHRVSKCCLSDVSGLNNCKRLWSAYNE